MRRKKIVSMLLVATMAATLFAGCGNDSGKKGGTETGGVKEFDAFFAVPGSEINDDNEIQKIIEEKTGVRVKETWLTGQTADEAVGTMIAGGVKDTSYTGLCKYNGSWWYVSGGKVNFGATGLCKYNGTWWYVKNGKVSFTTTLCKYNGIWWYINNGAVNFNKTTLVKYGSNWYAVAKGQVAWKYTGKLAYNGRYFNVVNGVVKF